MVTPDSVSLLLTVLRGAARAGVRVVVQAGWSGVDSQTFHELVVRVSEEVAAEAEVTDPETSREGVGTDAGGEGSDAYTTSRSAGRSKPLPWSPSDAYMLGAAPHGWLFQHVAAVVHHGGAGTTSAGLRAGKPTFVTPFFGDQHFWGEMVRRADVGPPPCPVQNLTVAKMVEALTILLSPDIVSNAKRFGEKLSREDGVTGAVEAFYRHLPVMAMVCDVALLMGESRLAVVTCATCGLKMCKDVHVQVHGRSDGSSPHKYTVCNYAPRRFRSAAGAGEGLLQGLEGASLELATGITEAVSAPINAAYGRGLRGIPVGIIHTVRVIIEKPIAGGRVFWSKLAEGLLNTFSGGADDSVGSVVDRGRLRGRVLQPSSRALSCRMMESDRTQFGGYDTDSCDGSEAADTVGDRILHVRGENGADVALRERSSNCHKATGDEGGTLGTFDDDDWVIYDVLGGEEKIRGSMESWQSTTPTDRKIEKVDPMRFQDEDCVTVDAGTDRDAVVVTRERAELLESSLARAVRLKQHFKSICEVSAEKTSGRKSRLAERSQRVGGATGVYTGVTVDEENLMQGVLLGVDVDRDLALLISLHLNQSRGETALSGQGIETSLWTEPLAFDIKKPSVKPLYARTI
eukprot:gene6875-8800_t